MKWSGASAARRNLQEGFFQRSGSPARWPSCLPAARKKAGTSAGKPVTAAWATLACPSTHQAQHTPATARAATASTAPSENVFMAFGLQAGPRGGRGQHALLTASRASLLFVVHGDPRRADIRRGGCVTGRWQGRGLVNRSQRRIHRLTIQAG